MHEESARQRSRRARDATASAPARQPARRLDRRDWMRIREKATEARREAARSNWRPLFSYTDNLDRLARVPVRHRTAAFEQLGKRRPPRRDGREFADHDGAAVPLVLVGRRPRRPVWTLRMDPDHASEVAGSPEMIVGSCGSPALLSSSAEPLDRLKSSPDRRVRRRLQVVRQRHRPEQADAAHPARRHRPARPQRRRQIDAAATGHRPAPAQPGRGPRARPRRLEQPRAQSPHRPVPRAGRLLRMDDRLRLRPHLRPPERPAAAPRPAPPPSAPSSRSA